MRIFVTGATGVIGRRVVPALVSQGHQVTAAVRAQSRRPELALRGVTEVQVSLFAPETLRRAMAGHEVVINLATHIPVSMARMFLPGGWRENDRIRREGSANLVDAALASGV